MSSTSRGCQPVNRFWRARYLPRITNKAKPARYISPYQRTASGPSWNAMGSNWGCTSIGRDYAPAASAAEATLRGNGQDRIIAAPHSPPGTIHMANNPRSRIITHGVARSPNRAMLRAVGFSDADFDKPIVGVANGHSTMNPCNAGIQPLVERAVQALEAAGAKPQTF